MTNISTTIKIVSFKEMCYNIHRLLCSDKKVECIDAEGKRVLCANEDCGFNSHLNEGEICNITSGMLYCIS